LTRPPSNNAFLLATPSACDVASNDASPLPVDVKQARQMLGGKSPNKF
jgi:hypothetical protein